MVVDAGVEIDVVEQQLAERRPLHVLGQAAVAAPVVRGGAAAMRHEPKFSLRACHLEECDIDELRSHDLYDQVSQAFAVFLPVKSVGVTGDGRRYDDVVGLRAVETIECMTARWAHLPYDLLARISTRIINEVKGINRVVYDISSKPPATIEWE